MVGRSLMGAMKEKDVRDDDWPGETERMTCQEVVSKASYPLHDL